MKRSSRVRIIGGQYRRRYIHFPGHHNIRPTHDRIRETVFNWLATRIGGASCLDLFAGSGAMGIEALSRHARHVTFVDQQNTVIKALQSNLTTLGCSNVQVISASVPPLPSELRQHQFDIVFLDPPYETELLIESAAALNNSGCLSHECLVYCEAKKSTDTSKLPINWQLWRCQQTATIVYGLWSVDAKCSATHI